MSITERMARTPMIAYFIALVLLAFLAEPYSFTRAWNQGRSAMLAIVPLVALEAGRRSLLRCDGRKRTIGSYLVIAGAGVFYFAVSQPSVRAAIISLGVGLGIDPLIAQYSWVWGLDYAASSIFIALLLYLSPESTTVTPLIYTAGMASFLFIDVLLPYNSLGPFGYVVPPVLRMVAALINLTGTGQATSAGNILMLHNSMGSMNLQVFWPSAGLHGIVIGLLVVGAICVKLGTGWTRGLMYLLAGALGSFLVNVVRLVLLAMYALGDITDPKAFEAFHSVIGELIFIPWIIAFVVVVVMRETKRSRTGGSRDDRKGPDASDSDVRSSIA